MDVSTAARHGMRDWNSYRDRCLKCEIPSGANWNMRYRMALFAFQLELAETPTAATDICAPRPVPGEPDGWPDGTFIVDTRTES